MEEKIDIDALVLSKQPDENNTLFIAVDGHGGSGKSTLAKWLAEKYKAEIIHTDDFASWNSPSRFFPAAIRCASSLSPSFSKTQTFFYSTRATIFRTVR
jgi:thymidylate kinase